MKKVLGITLSIGALCGFMLMGSTALACGEKAEKTSATTASSCEGKATTTAVKAVNSTGATCSVENKAACEAKGTTTAMTASATTSGCASSCGYAGKCEFRTVSIKGMTCGGCESSVMTALNMTPGVIKVVSVSHKEGLATLCIDPTKVEDKSIMTAVSNKGYEAEIIPAVATSTTNGTGKSCGATTANGEKAGCCAAKGTEAKTTSAKTDGKNPL